MCRVHVRNPTFGDYYMKDWFIRNDCIRIFSKQKQTDIGMLHSDLCIESNQWSLHAGWRSEVEYFKTCSEGLNLTHMLKY